MKYRFIVGVGLLIVLFIIFASCFSKPETISLEDQNMDIVRLSIYAFNEGDWTSFADLHSPAYLQHAPDYDTPISWSDYELSCRIAHRRLPDLQYRIEDIFSVKNKVACRLIWEFPNDSYQFKYRFPDGIVKGSLISISLVRDGKIIEEWLEYDPVIVNELIQFTKRMEHIK